MQASLFQPRISVKSIMGNTNDNNKFYFQKQIPAWEAAHNGSVARALLSIFVSDPIRLIGLNEEQ